MFYRSLYFLFPDEQTVHKVITELENNFSVHDKQFHAIAKHEHSLNELTGVTIHSKSPERIRHEMWLFYGSTVTFTIATIAVVASLLAASWVWTALFALIMIASQLVGYLFGNRFPNAQVERFRTGLSHGEVLLQIDVPRAQIRGIREFVEQHHPDVISPKATNWHVGAMG